MTRRRTGAALLVLSLILFAFSAVSFADEGQGSEHRNGNASENAKAPETASNPDQVCDGDSGGKSDTGHGANQGEEYDNTCDDAGYDPIPGNGVGEGERTGQPCTGCVGQADDKNPPGQMPNADEDGNNGYECDENQGVGKTNPAHTGCTQQGTTQTPPTNVGGTTTNTPPTDILGESTVKPTAVLGEQITRPQPTKVLGVQMARTGMEVIPLALVALAMLGMGLSLMRPPQLANARI
jgi:hypothetical protein